MSRGSTPGPLDPLWRVAASTAVLGLLLVLSTVCLLSPHAWIPEVARVWVAVLTLLSVVAFGARALLDRPANAPMVLVTTRVLGLRWWSLPLFDRELVDVRRQPSAQRAPLLVGAMMAVTGALLVLPLHLLASTLASPPTHLALSPGEARDHGMSLVGGEAEVRRMLGLQVRLQAMGEDTLGRRVASLQVEDPRTGATGESLLRPGRPLRVGPWVMRLRATETVDQPGALEVLVGSEGSDDVQLVRLYRGQAVRVPGTSRDVRWVREATDVSPAHGLAVDLEVRDADGTVAHTRLHEDDVHVVSLPSMGVSLRWSRMAPTERIQVELRPRSGEALGYLPLLGVVLLLIGLFLTLLSPLAVVGREGDAVLVARANLARVARLRKGLPVSDAEWSAWSMDKEGPT